MLVLLPKATLGVQQIHMASEMPAFFRRLQP